MDAKPKAWASEYAEWFELASVVDRYELRPPYPAETFKVLLTLADPANQRVLDAGCGLGDLARPLARLVASVDAVDRSEAMLTRARTLPGGAAPNLRWVLGDIEDAPLGEVYGLVVCGDSIHWFDWPVVFERFRRCLSPRGNLAVVQRHWRLGDADTERLAELYAEHSANRHFVPLDPVAALVDRGLFETSGSHTTAAAGWRPTMTELIGCHHSQNGFTLEKMDDPAAFDLALAREVGRWLEAGVDGRYDLSLEATITWGRPRSPGAPDDVAQPGLLAHGNEPA
jgi:SAM-dependent methyltransferase